jgi:hypothetical protein
MLWFKQFSHILNKAESSGQYHIFSNFKIGAWAKAKVGLRFLFIAGQVKHGLLKHRTVLGLLLITLTNT